MYVFYRFTLLSGKRLSPGIIVLQKFLFLKMIAKFGFGIGLQTRYQ